MQSEPAIVLPPGPAPRALTARAPTRTLHDHFLAFVASNNPLGFEADIVASISETEIGGLMLLAALKDSMRIDRFKDQAKKLKKASAGAIKHSAGLELMARLFGYCNWNEANGCAQDGRVINRRTDRDRINMKVFDIASRAQRGPNRST